MNPSSRRPIIIDTDLSFDDYVAIIYLLLHPAFDVRALTVTAGVVHLKAGLENACRLLALFDRGDIPVAGCLNEYLSKSNHSVPNSWRYMVDYIPRLWLPGKKSKPVTISSAELIRQQILASEVPISIVAIAPLTNLAVMLRDDPALATRIDTIFISGGAINVPGTIHVDIPSNPNTVSEWNFYLDPLAAEIVLKAGVRIVLIPLDITHVHGPHPLLFTKDFVRRLSAKTQGKVAKFMVRFIRTWQMTNPQFEATPIWDGAVAAIVANENIGSDWREIGIRIVSQPDEAAGQTLLDDAQPKVRLCLGADQTAFEAAYLAILDE